MVKEPEIVKFLREYENLGKLHLSSSKLNDQQFIDKNSITHSKQINKEENFSHNESQSTCFEDIDLYIRLVENLFEGILIIDITGKILFANKAIAKMLDIKDIKTYLGKNALDFIDPKHRKRMIKDQFLVSIDKGGFLNSYEARTSKGRKIWIEVLGNKINFKGKSANVVFIRDITDRKKTWDDLVRLKEKYQALAENSIDGILIIDDLGQVSYVNPSFEKMCKKKKENILMNLFRDHLSEKSIYLFQQVYIDARKNNKKIENIELELINGNKYSLPVEVNIVPLQNNDEFSGLLCTIRDIRERKKIEKELKKSEKLKTDFMNIAAHELKSPITPIKGYLDLIISDEKADKRIKKWAKIGIRNSERLLKLVDDILDVSRLDSDTMKFEMEKINLSVLLKEIAEDLKPTMKNKKLDFNLKISDDLPYVYADNDRLTQVFRNLLYNAIKFTDIGSILIDAKNVDNNALIKIKDTGIGISKEEINKIFSKFYQSYTEHDRNYEGTGLGLFICKEIINKHNGKIWAESQINKGSEFYVQLPSL